MADTCLSRGTPRSTSGDPDVAPDVRTRVTAFLGPVCAGRCRHLAALSPTPPTTT